MLKPFITLDDVHLDARIKHAAERNDTHRWVELRIRRGDDPINIAADLAAQEG